MKLTIEEYPETIKRYAHIRPAPGKADRCSTRCPGTSRRCSLERGHRGPHVAHGSFRSKVVAVWDDRAQVEEDRRKPVARQRASPARDDDHGPLWRIFLSFLPRRPPSIEAAGLLILFLGMVAFVMDWALRIVRGQ